MNKINGISFNCLEEFNSFLGKATQNQIQMEIDWDSNEWVWDKTGNEVTEFNILSVLGEYLKEEITDVIAEINGYFGECKIILLIKDEENRMSQDDFIAALQDNYEEALAKRFDSIVLAIDTDIGNTYYIYDTPDGFQCDLWDYYFDDLQDLANQLYDEMHGNVTDIRIE